MKLVSIILTVALAASLTTRADVVNRKAVVDRHQIVTHQTDTLSPAQVGNGKFAYGVDITGLQTFVPFNTMSDWAWHSFPLPAGLKIEDYKGVPVQTYGRQINYEMPDPAQPKLSRWLEGNPNKVNLGRLGLQLFKSDGTQAQEKDLTDITQRVDLWTGIITSQFSLEGVPVRVETACHANEDIIGVRIHSALVAKGAIKVMLKFPYAVDDGGTDYLGTYDQPDAHKTTIESQNGNQAILKREMDDLNYRVQLRWEGKARFSQTSQKHSYLLEPQGSNDLNFICQYTPDQPSKTIRTADVFSSSRTGWQKFWQSGAAIDLSGSKDSRWQELERRIVLSQYVLRMNEAGQFPPQESGLVNNGWYGRFHFEMIWWHVIHYAYWNRWPLMERMASIWKQYLPTSIERAKKQGYKGARWPKCTANFDREWPHPIHATLIWQQPHPIYFAETDYRQHPTKATLQKWADVVFQTADFMADYAHYDAAQKRYVLGPPIYIVSENTDMMTTTNPTFELSYWRYGLRVANLWRQRMGLPTNTQWKEVEEKLSPLPVQDGVYVTHEGIQNMWDKFNFEHPALIGPFGMLPGDGVDVTTMSRTLDYVRDRWQLNHTWGWDFPMLAMCATRLDRPMEAIKYLLEFPSFNIDEHGLVGGGGPFPYFPGNGGLLTAIAMMAGGWDGGPNIHAPGFPQDGSWTVRCEGFPRYQ